MIKHISFDVWLTLIRSNPKFKSSLNDLIIKSFEVKKDSQTVDFIFRKMDRTFTKVNEITGKNLDSKEMLLIILAEIDVKIENIKLEKLESFQQELLELFWKFPPILLDEKLPFLLKKLLGNDISLSILSNTGFIHGKTLSQLFEKYHFGQFFAFQCFSDEENFSKPFSQFFDIAYQNVLKIKKIEKNQVLHIGDNLVADYEGAKNYGFQAALFQHENNNLEKIIKENGLF
jgi:putative hydrolase of the HAD superfamily